MRYSHLTCHAAPRALGGRPSGRAGLWIHTVHVVYDCTVHACHDEIVHLHILGNSQVIPFELFTYFGRSHLVTAETLAPTVQRCTKKLESALTHIALYISTHFSQLNPNL